MAHKDSEQCLTGERILLGITGGIAAYKSADLARRLVRKGAEVQVVMTKAALAFITPLTMQAVSGRPVRHALLDPDAEADGMGHIELARWASHVLVAPASADFISCLAVGGARDLLSALCLATDAPVTVAPAMNKFMWQHVATQRNIARIKQDGVLVSGPDSGAQACGETGMGRMLEPQDLCEHLVTQFQPKLLAGCSVLITAGPTQEPIDQVRYISNRSSGKQGFALAQACTQAGAEVMLIAGPTHLPTPDKVRQINVSTAQEMHKAVMSQVQGKDLFIGVAAVADYRVAQVATRKIKKTDGIPTLDLVENPDIIAAVAALPQRPYVVGFAAETTNVLDHARQKLECKHLDMIILNDVGKEDIGFDGDYNSVTLITKDNETLLPKASKHSLAVEIVSRIAATMNTSSLASDALSSSP